MVLLEELAGPAQLALLSVHHSIAVSDLDGVKLSGRAHS